MYKVDGIIAVADNHALCFLQDGLDRAFLCEELMHIPENAQEPSEWLSKWKQLHIVFMTLLDYKKTP